jgi:hypothetical protein
VSFNTGPALTTAVKITGAVSPATRPMQTTIPVKIPGNAAGSTTVTMLRHLPAPRLNAASR